jgi:glycosyltransferase involved in cell wall biosynthesis
MDDIPTISGNEKKEESMEGKLSIIVPVTERHDNVVEIYYDFREALGEIGIETEFIYVIDGDFPVAYEDLKTLRDSGEKFTIIKHARTFGESTSITEGFKHCRGDFILTLPSYFQVEASEVKKLVRSMDNCDIAVVRRWPRVDSGFNQFQTRMFHRLVQTITGVKINDVGCSVRIMKRSVLEEINLYGDLHRFLPILADKQGFKVKEIELRQSHREKRVRKYAPGVYIRRLIDLLSVFFLVKFTKKPLRFFGLAGTAILIPGMLLTLYLLIGRAFGKFALSERPLFLLGILLIVLGIQIFAIGLVGEIIIFTHAREIKEYTIEEIIN